MQSTTSVASPAGEFADVAPAALLVMPAYAALALATGAGAYGLAHLVDDSSFTLTIYAALALSLLVSYGSQCGGAAVVRWCHRIKWLVVGGLLPLLVIYNFRILIPQGFSAESQQILATIMGWVMIASVLSVGTHYRSSTGLVRVPLAAPLVSTISLFGVLNNASVDTGITVAFLVHVVGALYLVVYEYMLRLLAREAAARHMLRHTVTVGGGSGTPSWNLRAAARFDIGGVALQYLLACSVWFACFTVGGLLIYYPFKAILPSLYKAPPGGMGRNAFRRSLDWRRSSSTLELLGGTYNLSDQEILKITVKGESSGLWQGRIYENYRHSIWQDEIQSHLVALTSGSPTKLLGQLPPLAARLGEYRYLMAQVQPIHPVSRVLYTCGQAQQVRGPWREVLVSPTGTLAMSDRERNQAPYDIGSVVTQANLNTLAGMPGLAAGELTAWRKNSATLQTLQVPDEPSGTSDQIVAIAQGIQQAAQARSNPLTTPYQKVQAINDYLRRTCAYSLVTPNVPPSQDAVIFFLTRSHEGACDMFASSMAVLLRAMDVPARIATGYLEPGPEAQTPGVAGTSFTERERDAHAWTQYYVPSVGWLDFDPTQGTRLSQITLAMRLASWLHLGQLNVRWQTIILPGVGLLLLLIGGVWSLLEARQGAGQRLTSPQEIERSRITGAYGDAVRLLSRYARHAPHYTPQEYEAVVTRADLDAAIKQDFAALTYLFIAAHYAPLAVAVDEAQLQSCLQRLRHNLR